MFIHHAFSDEFQSKILSLNISYRRITDRRRKTRNNKEQSNFNSTADYFLSHDVLPISTISNEPQSSDSLPLPLPLLDSSNMSIATSEFFNVTTLAEILADFPKDDIPPVSNISSEELPSQGQLCENSCAEETSTGRLKGKFVSDNVFNLSRKNLSGSEISLLDKGLSFVPTPEKIDKWQVKKDLEKFGRNIRLKMYFANEPTPSFSEKPAFKIPSKWTPFIRDTQLEIYLSEIEEEIMKIDENGHNYPNLSKDERDAIKNLIDDDSIIIKPADKGSSVIVWDKEDYLKECGKQLNDNSVYQKIDKDPIPSANKKIKAALDSMLKKKEIDKKLSDFLYIKHPELGRFYLLPKIHKRLQDIPGRPVISNNNTCTENISAYLDYHLKPLIPKIKHILEDTRDFLVKIANITDIPDNSYLVSFDVVGLYPNIPHEEGIQIMEKYLDEREDKTVSTKSLCELGKLILKNNFFENGNDFYHQKTGTAIGTKFAPPYANLFMAGIEEKLFLNKDFNPLLWLRYLDDIFCIWVQGLEKLDEFYKYLNSFHPTIKFTMEYSSKQINFLDVTVIKKDGKLQTDLFCKETDTHQYLHSQSCHRNIYKKSIPYGQAVRMKRICSTEETLSLRLEQLESWLIKRGYKKEVIQPEINRVHSIDRMDLLEKREKVENNEITLVLTYHPALNTVYEILQKAHRHVVKSPRLFGVLPSPPRLSFRNSKTLRDRLVRSKLKCDKEREPGIYKCGHPSCEICNVLDLQDTFSSTVTGKVYKINFPFDCNSKSVIYLLTCKICKKQYVGSTVTKFRLRFNQYKSNIKLYGEGQRGFNQDRLIEHFFQGNHNGNYRDISVKIIDHCDPKDQERREDFWIFTLQTLHPKGLNHKIAE